MLFGMNNNNPQLDKVEVPSLDTIQDLPNVDLPKLDEAQQPVAPVSSPANSAAQQPPAIPQVPTVPQTQTYNYAPPQTAPYAAAGQPIITTKRSGGQIVALVFGIILTIIFGMLCLLLFIGDAVSGFVDFSSTIFGYGFFGFFLAIGIILIVKGAGKGKKIVSVVPPQQYTAMPTQPYSAAPVQNIPQAQPVAAPAQNIPQAQPVAAPAQNIPQAQPAAQANEGSASAAFNYSPTSMINDDSKAVAKKSARKSAFLSMGVVLIMWVVLIAIIWFLNRWVFSWYFLIIPVIISIGAIKNYPKSLSAWISLVISILSIVLFVVVSMQLAPYFE